MTCADFYKVWELPTADKINASKFAWDGGSIIIKIIELEIKTEIEFEYEHIKSKIVNENRIISKGFKIVLECDQKEKEDIT